MICRDEKCKHNFSCKNLKRKDQLGDVSTQIIILKWTLRCGLDTSSSAGRPVARCEHSDKPSGPTDSSVRHPKDIHILCI
jgi:hypothetical protein